MSAIASILHRITGVFLFLLIPFLLWAMEFSLSSEQHFLSINFFMGNFWFRFVAWVFMSCLVYHFLAGIRHLLMDAGIGESLRGGRLGAWLVFLISAVIIVLLGVKMLIGIY